MKKWQKTLIVFSYFAVMASAFELMNYFIANDMLGRWNIFAMELLLLNIGYFGAILEMKLSEKKRRKRCKGL